VAGAQRVDAPYVPYKNAHAGRRGGERRGQELAAEGGGEVGNGDRTLEKRRHSGWVRLRKPRYPGRSSAVNRDEEGVGPGPGPVVQLLPVDFFYFCFTMKVDPGV